MVKGAVMKVILGLAIIVVILVLLELATMGQGVVLFVSVVIFMGIIVEERHRGLLRNLETANAYIKQIKKLPSDQYDKKAFHNCKKQISVIVRQVHKDRNFNIQSERLLDILLKDLKKILVISTVK